MFFSWITRIAAVGAAAVFITTTVDVAPASAQHARCHNYATATADSTGARGGNVAGGAIAGGLAGAVIGSFAGNAGRGAAIGGTAGAVGGLVRGSQAWQRVYNAAYADCMGQSRGPVYQQPVQSYSCIQRPEWLHQQCSARFRSYDRCSGTFQPYNGPRRLCQ